MKNETYTDPLEEMRRKWRDMQVDVAELKTVNERLSQRLASSKVITLQEKLSSQQRMYSWIGLLLLPLAVVMYFAMDMPLWVCVPYALFGLVMSVCGRLLSDYVSEQPLLELPVAEALRRAITFRLRQQQLRIAGFCFGSVVIFLFMFSLFDTNQTSALFGGFIGLAIGLAVSIPRCIRMARMARKLVESLKEIDEA